MIAIIERTRLLAWALVLMLAVPLPVLAQSAPAPPAAAPPSGASETVFTAEQLEQVAAPIALYPDPLVAQVLMASTYPLEVVQASRFVKANPKLQGDQLNEKLKDQDWDDSVKSLVQFPQVLDLMNEKLEWTQKLGDAVLAQQKELLDAIQRLRARAQKEGNLKSTNEQKVSVEQAPAPPPSQTTVVVQEQPAQIIKIEPANPQVVYVPSYNPQVVYGAWPYPAYPPYYPYPPGYAWGAAALSFGVGMAVGAAVWGNCNWGGGNVDVDINKNANFSRNVNKTDVAAKRTERAQQGQRGSGSGGGRSQWQHNPESRKGVQYRDQGTAQKFNRGQNPQAAQSREQFRGRADQGRQDLGRGGGQGAGRAQTAGGQGSFGGGQGGGRAQTAGGQGSFGGGGRDSGAFSGLGGGGDVKGSSSRGQASRESLGGSGSRGGGSSFSGGSGSRGSSSVSGGSGSRGGSSGFSGGGGSRGGGGGGGGSRGGGGGGGGGGGRGGGRR